MLKYRIYHGIIGVFDESENLNFQAYGELESKRLYDVSVNTLREEK